MLGPMTKEHWAAGLSILGALAWLPLLVITIRDNTGGIDGGNASSTYGRDRLTDAATVIAFVGVLCAAAAGLLLLVV
jgi:hypothetical protein